MTRHTILIIEDDQPTRELYERELGVHYAVLAQADNCNALETIRASRVSALILEPALAEERGWALVPQIRGMPDLRALPIIVCSTQSARRRAIALGATLYLMKPVLPSELLKSLQRVLAARQHT